MTEKEIFVFIVDNSDNTELMDKINKTTYPFTSKFKKTF